MIQNPCECKEIYMRFDCIYRK